MKRMLTLGTILFCFFLLGFPVHAMDNGSLDSGYTSSSQKDDTEKILEEQYEASGANQLMDALPEGVEERLNENGIESPSAQDMQQMDIFSFFKQIFSSALQFLKSPVIILALSFGIILICALFESFQSTLHHSMNGVLQAVAALALCGVILTPMVNCIQMVASSIKGMGTFLFCFIPVFTTLISTSGAPAAAMGYNTALFGTAQLISTVTAHILLPFAGIFLAVSVCCAVSGQFNLSSLTGTIRKIIVWGLTFMVTIFVGIFSAQNMVVASADSLTVRTAKFMSGSFVPVVGSALTEAVGSVMGCLGVIKNSVGAFGIVVCMLTFLPMIFLVLFYMAVVKLSGCAADILGVKNIPILLNAVYDTLTILLAFLICYAVLIIVTMTLMIFISAG